MLVGSLTPETLLAKARLLHDRGQVEPAFELYKQILSLAPGHLPALVGMGRALLQVGQTEDARVVLDKAVARAPDDAEAQALLGMALRELGLSAEAERRFERAAALNPESPETWCNLGLSCLETQHWPAAADAFRRSLAIRADYPEALNGLAEALMELGDEDGARAALDRVIRANPDLVEAHNNLGRLHMGRDCFAEAAACFERALERSPADRSILTNLAGAKYNLEHYEEAAALCEQGLERAPDDVDLLRQLGSIYWAMDRLEDSLGYVQRASALEPDCLEDLLSIGRCLVKLRRPAEALEPLQRAREIAPESASAANWLAQAKHMTFQFEEAEALYHQGMQLDPEDVRPYVGLVQVLRDWARMDEAYELGLKGLALDPESALMRNQHAVTLLSLGRWGEGMDVYESRFDKESGLKHGYRRGVQWDLTDQGGAPMWQGEPLDGKRIALFAEQGPGDVIMYLNCLPEVIEQADEVQLIVQSRMAELMQRSFPTVKVEGHQLLQHGLNAPRSVDFNMPIGSLTRYLRRTDADFPGRGKYLKADPDKAAFWRDRFRALLPGGEGITIGISWRGGIGPYFGGMRQMDLTDWLPLLRCPGTAFVSLQYGTREDRKGWLDAFEDSSGIRIADWDDSDPTDDLDGLAAQVEALDLIVSIANTTVHFAGAMGRPCWTIVPKMPSWRWVRGRTDSVWYPTMRLFWQHDDEDSFAPVMERVAAQYLQNASARRFYPDSWRGEPGDEEGS